MDEITPANPPPATPPPPSPAPDVTPPPPASAPPPATKIVVEGTKTEREIELERRLNETEARAKKAETDAGYHADEARKARELLTAVPAPRAKQKRTAVGFWEVEE
jgi:hypothetical protein